MSSVADRAMAATADPAAPDLKQAHAKGGWSNPRREAFP
jgi:hypothetical protein